MLRLCTTAYLVSASAVASTVLIPPLSASTWCRRSPLPSSSLLQITSKLSVRLRTHSSPPPRTKPLTTTRLTFGGDRSTLRAAEDARAICPTRLVARTIALRYEVRLALKAGIASSTEVFTPASYQPSTQPRSAFAMQTSNLARRLCLSLKTWLHVTVTSAPLDVGESTSPLTVESSGAPVTTGALSSHTIGLDMADTATPEQPLALSLER